MVYVALNLFHFFELLEGNHKFRCFIPYLQLIRSNLNLYIYLPFVVIMSDKVKQLHKMFEASLFVRCPLTICE